MGQRTPTTGLEPGVATLLDQVPSVSPDSRNSVVILRVRGADDAGATLIDVLSSYADSLNAADCRLMLVTDNSRVIRQLRVTGATDSIGADNVYRSTAFMGETTRKAHDDAVAWIEANRVSAVEQVGPEPDDAATADDTEATDD